MNVGIMRVQEQERRVIERFKAFDRIVGPGLKLKVPLSYMESVRASPRIWEQPIELFPEEPSIDFKGGGTAVLKGANIWVKINREIPREEVDDLSDRLKSKITRGVASDDQTERAIRINVYRCIYEIDNWQEAIRERAEIAFRSVLNKLTVEQALALSRDDQAEMESEGSFLRSIEDKIEQQQQNLEWMDISWMDIIETAFPDFTQDLERWGFKACELTLSDFAWSEEVRSARQKVFESERQIEIEEYKKDAAAFKAEKSAMEAAKFYAESKDIIMRHGGDQEEAKQTARELTTHWKSAETGQLQDIRPMLKGFQGALPEIIKLFQRS